MQKIAKIVQAITYWPTYLILRFFIHYEVKGQENLKGLEDKGVIFASNHTSYIDGPISAASMPAFSWYPIRFLALKKFFNFFGGFPFPISFFTAAYVRLNGSIPVERAGGDLFRVLREVIKELKDGAKVWIFPEGGRTKDGSLGQGKRGVMFLHQQTGAPIVPVALIGTFGILSFKTLLRKNKVKVKIGKPIYSLGNCTLENCDLDGGVAKVMSEIARLME